MSSLLLVIMGAVLFFLSTRQPVSSVLHLPTSDQVKIKATADSHGSPVEVKSSGGTTDAASPGSRITWATIHSTLRFRFGAVNELPYRQYEYGVLRREAPFRPDVLKAYDESISFINDIDSRLDSLTQGLDPIAQKRVLIDMGLGLTDVPQGVEKTPARVRAVLQLWKFGRDESIVPQLESLLYTSESDVGVAAATLMANWGELSTIDRWVTQAEASKVEDLLATLAVPSTVKSLRTSDYGDVHAMEARGHFRPELAAVLIRRLGTTESPALQMRLVSFLSLVAYDEAAADFLLKEGKTNSNLSIRSISLSSLGPALERPEIADELLAISAGPDELMADAALGSFRYHVARESDVNALIKLLKSPSSSTTVKVLEVLETAPAKFKSLIIPSLEALSTSSSDETIRKRANECKKVLNKKRVAQPR